MDSEREHGSWRDLLARSIDLGLGALLLTKEAAQKAMDELISKGHVTKDEGRDLLNRMLERGKEQKERLEQLVRENVAKALEKADLARGRELREARAQITDLQGRLDRLEMNMTTARPPHEPPA